MPRLWTTAVNRGIEGRLKKEDIIPAESKEELFYAINDRIKDSTGQELIRLGVSARCIENIDGLFAEYSDLTNVELIGWELPRCVSMKGLFSGCKNLKKVNFRNCDFSRVESMRYMFSGCMSLTSINGIEACKVSNLKDMEGMFDGCENLEEVDFRNCDFPKVESMRYMFSGCKKLTSIKGIEKWNVSNLKDMEGMFDGCPVQYKQEADKLIKENNL